MNNISSKIFNTVNMLASVSKVAHINAQDFVFLEFFWMLDGVDPLLNRITNQVVDGILNCA